MKSSCKYEGCISEHADPFKRSQINGDTLDDEATALADSVPKTGDTANAAIPFGFAAFAAFAGAFVTRMRRRNN